MFQRGKKFIRVWNKWIMIEFSFCVKDYLLKISPSPKHWHFHCVPWKKSSIPVGASIKTSRGRANHDRKIVWLFTKTVHFYQVWTVRFHILSRGYSIPVFFHSSSYFLNPKVWHSAKSDWNFTALDHYQLKALKNSRMILNSGKYVTVPYVRQVHFSSLVNCRPLWYLQKL